MRGGPDIWGGAMDNVRYGECMFSYKHHVRILIYSQNLSSKASSVTTNHQPAPPAIQPEAGPADATILN